MDIFPRLDQWESEQNFCFNCEEREIPIQIFCWTDCQHFWDLYSHAPSCHWGGKVCVKMECVRAQLLQSCPTVFSLMDHSPSGSSVCGTFLARILEWVGISSSRGSSWPRDQTRSSCGFCVGRQCFTTVLSGLGSPISFTASKNFDKLVSFIKIFLYFSLDLYFDPSMC